MIPYKEMRLCFLLVGSAVNRNCSFSFGFLEFLFSPLLQTFAYIVSLLFVLFVCIKWYLYVSGHLLTGLLMYIVDVFMCRTQRRPKQLASFWLWRASMPTMGTSVLYLNWSGQYTCLGLFMCVQSVIRFPVYFFFCYQHEGQFNFVLKCWE